MAKLDDLMRQGLALHQSGRIADAQAIYARVLAKEPSHAAANHLTGLAFLQRGDSAAAVKHLQRAVHIRGNDPEYLANLGTALNAAGRPEEALEAFDKSLKLQPNNPAALNNKAMSLKALYRHDGAIAAYRAAIVLRPTEAGFHRNLANALSELGDWHGAERAYRDALNHRNNFPSALTGLVNALEALQRRDEAIEIASSYAGRYPGESEYHRALGHAHWTAGNPEAAATAYRAAIAANPRDVEAYRMLGTIVPHASEHDPELSAARQLLEDKGLSEDQQAQLEFTLGAALTDIGDDARALKHFSRGNAIIRRLRPFDLDAARSEIEAVKRRYSERADLPPLLPPTGPIFIVGLPRSGKSTLEGMLARHPDLFSAGELQAAGVMSRYLPPAAFGERYRAMAAALAPGRRIIDTMPNNFRLLGLLRAALPEARVLFCTREPEGHALALSQKYFSLRGNEYASDPADALAFIGIYTDLMSFWSARFPGFLHPVEMNAVRTKMRQLLGFVGVPWEPACAEPYLSEPRVSPAA